MITDLNLSQRDEGDALAPETGRGQAASPQPSPRASACEPYQDAIELGLTRGRNARAIWQDLVYEYAFATSYQSVQRFVRKRRGTQMPEARVVIETAPGRRGAGRLRHRPHGARSRAAGKYRRTRLFVMTLGYSRKSVRLLVFRSSSRIWAELHETGLSPAGRRDARGRAR